AGAVQPVRLLCGVAAGGPAGPPQRRAPAPEGGGPAAALCPDGQRPDPDHPGGDGGRRAPRPASAHPRRPGTGRALRERFAWRYPAAGLAAVPAKVSVTSIVHQTGETTLERPAFLAKEGLSAAEMGTALHAFLEHADFAALAAPARQGRDVLLA